MAEITTEITSQSRLALHALQEYSEQKRGKMLFPDAGSSVFLVTKWKKIPLRNHDGRRVFIQLPCPDRNASNTSICLIMPDRDHSKRAARDPDVDRQAREWAELIHEKHGIVAGQHYSKLFTFKQLEREYSMFPDRSKLANAYDIFMVDRKLTQMADNFMGKYFKKMTKMPLPFNAHQNFAKKLEKAYALTVMALTPLKDTVTIRIGNLSQPLADLEANLRVVVDSLVKHCPGGTLNIRACHIYSMQESLPVFVDFGSANDVKLKKSRPRQYPVEVDECSTLPDGLAVKVRADGQVTTVDAKTGKEVAYPTEQDEWERTDDIKPLSQEKIDKMLQRMAGRKKRAKVVKVKKEEVVKVAPKALKNRKRKRKQVNNGEEELKEEEQQQPFQEETKEEKEEEQQVKNAAAGQEPPRRKRKRSE